jgi:acetyl/propionyl-CoA carboxylase alpha subunit/acetyl-CoA carboxylase carboxyltransferase component
MSISKILIANRGEIAIRIARASADLGIPTTAIYSADDSKSLHTLAADEACALDGRGPAAYLDIEKIINLAGVNSCDAIHPGYGFLSENSAFARRCAECGIKFIGPEPEMLGLFGNKVAARQLAQRCGVPLLPGTTGPTSLEEALAFFSSLGPKSAIVIKAIMGGGGRGIRAVYSKNDLDEAFARCQSEARTAFGVSDLYVEQLVRRPRHLEIQIVGDGKKVIHLGERDCTLQRRNQKVVEIAPCPTLSAGLREKITGAALRMADEAHYVSLGTFEFLLDDAAGDKQTFAFMEVNPRLQVEHSVTEEVSGVDLVRTQIEIACGKSLADLGLTKNAGHPRFYAVQLRINMETMDPDGNAVPACGTLNVYEPPSGPGIRVDGYGYSGYTTNPAFDSLLAKLIVTSKSPIYGDAVAKARRALREFRVDGLNTNISFLLNLLQRPEVANNEVYTRFIEDNSSVFTAEAQHERTRFFETSSSGTGVSQAPKILGPAGTFPVTAPMQGCVVDIEVIMGDAVTSGQKLVVLESMKMEHVITSDRSGYVRAICVALNDGVSRGDPLIYLEEADISVDSKREEKQLDLNVIRKDLAEVMERDAFTLDQNRPEAVARRRKKGQRTARENIDALCDPGSFIEYGPLIVAAQRSRRSMDDLIRRTPADGLIAGLGSVNGSQFGDEKTSCLVMAYDYTVLAGTQGQMNHKKMDRVLHIANEWKLPTILFAEGGGGRPGDVDANTVAGLDLTTFNRFGSLSGKAPLIGIVEGPCFAGNAALLGCCDVIIATRNSNIGMGGPAMIEGGGLGVVKPEDIGPIDVQTRNGVVDISVADEAAAVASAKKYLSYFQGATTGWKMQDQRLLRWLIPENRLRVYDVRRIIETLADSESVLELRQHFGLGMVTSLIRIEGKPFGVIANDSKHMGGAIEADDADKAARFIQLCNVHRIPLISLCDTPGFMVGPEIEVHAQVRHVCRMFVVGAKVTVPFFTVVLRKGYGLGAMAMSAGGFHNSFFTTCWPTGEFGGMGLEGAVKHGFRKELEAIKDPDEREKRYKYMVEQAYAMGRAINMASFMEIDSVIDPAETRRWLTRGLKSAPPSSKDETIPQFIDPW